MKNSKDNFNLQINEAEFQQWYKNWREEGMPTSPTDTSFEIWMDMKISKEFKGVNTLLGKTLWYAVSQESQTDLEMDIFHSGVFIENGKVLKEDNESLLIEGYDKSINKKLLSEYVFLNRSSLLFNLHYDGDSLYSGKQINSIFLEDDFIIEDF